MIKRKLPSLVPLAPVLLGGCMLDYVMPLPLLKDALFHIP